MATHFILDKKQKEERETVARILELAEKRPYPDKETIHMASFIDACFLVIEEEKRKEIEKRMEEIKKKLQQEEERRRKAQELARKKELEKATPEPEKAPSREALPPLLEGVPEAPQQNLQKREYVLNIYNNPVGVLVDKEENGKYLYHSIEPVLEKEIQNKAREWYGREFEKDNSLFDNENYLKKISEKLAKKSGLAFSDMLPQKVRYYLERDILGAGPFDPLLYDEKVKTIICEGPNKNLRIEYDDLGMMETNISISNGEELKQFLKRLATATGKILNEQNPILESSFQGLKFEGLLGIGGTNAKLTIRRLPNAP